MTRTPALVGTLAVLTALLVVPLSGTALAHGEASGEAAEFYKHMDVYAHNINNIIAQVNAITAGYEPGKAYAEEIDALVEKWESVEFHEAVETNAVVLYPPVWAAIGAFSTALKQGAAASTVQARAEDIAAALWQGYGGLKLLAARRGNGHGTAHEHATEEQAQASAQTGGDAVIDTINANLDRVLVLYKKGQNEAAKALIADTYLGYFEGIEGDLIEQNAELVAQLELDFNATLPGLISKGAPAAEVAAQIEAMQADLNKARKLLKAAEAQESSVF